jgi:hypothetical protein
MPRFWLLGVTWLVACAGPEFQQQRLQDGSLKITCELTMDECVQRAQDLCQNKRFRILDGQSETRLRDAPPFERAYHTSRLHLKCTNDGADPLLSLSPAASSSAAPTVPSPPPLACTIGETRTCVGPGACQGGQACLADRTGFGACDCGPAAPSPVPVAPAGSSTGPVPSPLPPPSSTVPPPSAGAPR